MTRCRRPRRRSDRAYRWAVHIVLPLLLAIIGLLTAWLTGLPVPVK